ncbi:MAG: hypothetical protein WD512_17950 [Candidatus Paceibacterota bacterium]
MNNVIELNTFLDYIQTIVIGVRGNQTKTDELRKEFPYTVEVNEKEYEITIELLLFFYNAQFKGLLIDGGYFNNIPFNYFRDKGNDPTKLDGVLAIKLDRSFPPDFMEQVRDILEPLKHKEEEIIKRVEREEMELGRIIPLNEINTSEFDMEFERVIIQIHDLLNADVSRERVKALRRKFRQDKGSLKKEEKEEQKKEFKDITQNRKIILKIIHDWYIQNGAYDEVKPWEIPRPILDIAFTGYSYGSKRGQIRDMTDHKYIISLYDYGVGT